MDPSAAGGVNAASSSSSTAPGAGVSGQRRPSAPYGHACMGCSRAKSRCIGRTADTACERCRRLRRDCQPSTVVRKGRSRRPRSPAPSKTAVLEQKLDNLVNMLASQGSLSTTPASTTTGGDGVQQEQTVENTDVSTNAQPSAPAPARYRHLTPSDDLTGHGSSLWYLTDPPERTARPRGADEECLEMFKKYHLRSFPIMHFPSGVGPSQIKADKPLLWLAIQTVCSKSSKERAALDQRFREEFAKRYIVDMERSMELLLGLLTYMSWWVTMRHMGQKILCTYSSMAVSLVFDLRLDRLGRWNPCKETDAIAAYSSPLKAVSPPVYRTNEERRAVIACFCVCATVSSFLRTAPMRWTPHMEDTLEHLAKSPEVFGDEQLAAMARALRIGEDVLTASGWRFFEPEAYTPPKPPPMVHVKALRSNLDVLRQSLRPGLASDKTIQAYLTWTDAMINELPLLHRPAPNSSGPGWIDFGRAECFHACVEALRTFVDNWFLFDHHEIFGMFIGLGLHFAQATHMIYRLSMAPASGAGGGGEDPGWDRQSVRNAIDLPRILIEGADKFVEVSQVVGLETDDSSMDPYLLTGVGLKQAATQWAKTFADTDARRSVVPSCGSGGVDGAPVSEVAETAAAAAGGVGGIQGSSAGEGLGDGEDLPMMDFSAGFWMPDLFETWDSV